MPTVAARPVTRPTGPVSETRIQPHAYVDDPRTGSDVADEERICILCDEPKLSQVHTKQSHVHAAAVFGTARRLFGAAALPWYGGGSLALAGVAVTHAPLAALTGPVAAYGVTKLTPSRLLNIGRDAEPEEVAKARRYLGWCTAAGCTWLAAAAMFGVDPHTASGAAMLAALIPATGFAGVPYWGWRRDGRRRHEPKLIEEPVVEEPVEDFGSLIAQKWLDTVGSRSGALHESWLEGPKRIIGGWEAEAAGPDGKFTPAIFRQALPRVASAYGVGVVSVSMVPNPANAGRCRVLVQPRSPLERVREWDGSGIDVATGAATIVTLTDGTRGQHQLWQPGYGPRHELIVGDSGSGKSEYANLLFGLEYMCDRVVSWVGDPQMGQSMGRSVRHGVDWFAATRDEIVLMLRTARRLILGRNITLARMSGLLDTRQRADGVFEWDDEEIRYLDPSRDFPLVCITIDEAYIPLEDREVVKLMAFIAKAGRKSNVKLRLIMQSPLLGELKDNTLRSQMRSGVVTMFRLAESASSAAAWPGKLPADPAELPLIWDATGETTAGIGFQSLLPPMLMRTDYPRPVMLQRLMRGGNITTLEPGILPVVGEAYAKRGERLREFEATDPDRLLAQLEEEDREAAGEQPGLKVVGGQKDALDPKGEEKVLTVLAHGRPMRNKDIGARLVGPLHLSTRQMGNVLKKLTLDKKITNRNGVYQLVQKREGDAA